MTFILVFAAAAAVTAAAFGIAGRLFRRRRALTR